MELLVELTLRVCFFRVALKLVGHLWCQPTIRAAEDFLVADSQRLDPALLPQGEPDEEAQLDQLRVCEMAVEPLPQGVVRDRGVPDNRAGIGQCRFLPIGEFIGVLEVQQPGVLLFGDTSLSGPDRPLDPSILAVDRLRDIDPAEFLDAVVEDPGAEGGLPGLREGADDGWNVGADRLALRPRRALEPRVLQVAEDLGVCDRREVWIRDSGHLAPPIGIGNQVAGRLPMPVL